MDRRELVKLCEGEEKNMANLTREKLLELIKGELRAHGNNLSEAASALRLSIDWEGTEWAEEAQKIAPSYGWPTLQECADNSLLIVVPVWQEHSEEDWINEGLELFSASELGLA
jgi:hypothetical protein